MDAPEQLNESTLQVAQNLEQAEVECKTDADLLDEMIVSLIPPISNKEWQE